jgi:ribosome-associated toxin RatA of RatAB toxin-antitoxin module
MATRTEVFDCTPEQMFQVVTDYAKYHEFLPEVRQCRVLRQEGDRKLVQFDVNVIKTFSYRLWMTEAPPTSLSWSLEGGDLFKLSNGSWKLEDQGGKTRATYSVEGKFKVFIPSIVEKNLMNNSLPRMFANYRSRIEALF